MLRIIEALTFDDVLLIPQHSKILPTEVDVSTTIANKIHLKIPVMSAAMDTVSESSMAIAMANLGGISIIHKNMSIEAQAKIIRAVKQDNIKNIVGAAIGHQISDNDENNSKIRVEKLIEAGVDLIVIDTAHGHSQLVIDCVKWFKKVYPEFPLVAGNIATAKAALDLAEAGVDAVKVGIGPGSICTTRIISGVGVPALTAIMMVVDVLKDTGVSVIADGGMKHSGDIVKAIAAGADAVMLGGMLAGTDESPGEIVEVEGKKYKSYRGMGSLGAIEGSKDRYFQHQKQGKFVTEGVEGLVQYKGSVEEVIYQIIGGLKSGMGYNGAKNLLELHKRAEFVKITNAGSKESYVHNLSFVKPAPNYKHES